MSTIDIADAVHHGPSGEDWVVARVDGEHLYASGWPCERAKLADCTLLQKATAKQRADLIEGLKKLPTSDPRHFRAEAVNSTEYCWARDEEGPYSGLHDTAEQAAVEGLASSDYDGVYVGEKLAVDLEDLVDEDGLIDTMMCRASDEVGDCADDWLSAIKQADRDALKAAIMPAIAAWVEARDPIRFWKVINTRYVPQSEIADAGLLDDDEQDAAEGFGGAA